MLIISKKKLSLSNFVSHKYIDILININVFNSPSKIKHGTNDS